MRLIDADILEGDFLEKAKIMDDLELDEYAGRGLNCYEFKKLLDEQPTVERPERLRFVKVDETPKRLEHLFTKGDTLIEDNATQEYYILIHVAKEYAKDLKVSEVEE